MSTNRTQPDVADVRPNRLSASELRRDVDILNKLFRLSECSDPEARGIARGATNVLLDAYGIGSPFDPAYYLVMEVLRSGVQEKLEAADDGAPW